MSLDRSLADGLGAAASLTPATCVVKLLPSKGPSPTTTEELSPINSESSDQPWRPPSLYSCKEPVQSAAASPAPAPPAPAPAAPAAPPTPAETVVIKDICGLWGCQLSRTHSGLCRPTIVQPVGRARRKPKGYEAEPAPPPRVIHAAAREQGVLPAKKPPTKKPPVPLALKGAGLASTAAAAAAADGHSSDEMEVDAAAVDAATAQIDEEDAAAAAAATAAALPVARPASAAAPEEEVAVAVQEEDGAGGGGELLRTASEAELLRALAEAHEAQAAAELNGTRRAIRRNSARNSLTPPPSLLSGTNDEERAFSIRDEAVRAVVSAATYESDPEAEAAADFAVKHRVSCGFPPVPSLADVEMDFALPHDFTAPAPPPRAASKSRKRARPVGDGSDGGGGGSKPRAAPKPERPRLPPQRGGTRSQGDSFDNIAAAAAVVEGGSLQASRALLALRDFLPKGHHDTAANATFKSVESDRLDTLYAAAGITWGCACGGHVGVNSGGVRLTCNGCGLSFHSKCERLDYDRDELEEMEARGQFVCGGCERKALEAQGYDLTAGHFAWVCRTCSRSFDDEHTARRHGSACSKAKLAAAPPPPPPAPPSRPVGRAAARQESAVALQHSLLEQLLPAADEESGEGIGTLENGRVFVAGSGLGAAAGLGLYAGVAYTKGEVRGHMACRSRSRRPTPRPHPMSHPMSPPRVPTLPLPPPQVITTYTGPLVYKEQLDAGADTSYVLRPTPHTPLPAPLPAPHPAPSATTSGTSSASPTRAAATSTARRSPTPSVRTPPTPPPTGGGTPPTATATGASAPRRWRTTRRRCRCTTPTSCSASRAARTRWARAPPPPPPPTHRRPHPHHRRHPPRLTPPPSPPDSHRRCASSRRCARC